MRVLHMIGNAHLDLAWIWPWQEGLAEVKATFLSALERMEEFGGFIFTSSSARYYAWVEENAPELFERIRQRVQEGRWVLCGGWWVQPDCNFPSAESYVRQGLEGQRYFQSRFGVTASVGYNVDSFGHNGGLPQILRKSGMDGYMCLRPNEQELELPAGAYFWEGVDGSRVKVCRIPVNYSSILGLDGHIQDVLTHYPADTENYICFYGVGNHGGGPTIDNIRYILAHEQLTPDIRLKFSDPRTYLDAAYREMDGKLPVHRGELQHNGQGCYSTGVFVKQANRQAESGLLAAEAYMTLAGMLPLRQDKPSAALSGAWQRLLACQFHDVICGVAIREVERAALRAIGGVCDEADHASNHALQAISFNISIPLEDKSQPLVAFNPNSFPIRTLIYHEKGSWGNFSYPDPCKVVRGDGTEVPFQFTHLEAQLDIRQRIAILAEIPPLGYETFRIIHAEKRAEKAPQHPDWLLENEFIRMELDPETGLLRSLVSKSDNAELLSSPSAQFRAYPDESDTWGHEASIFHNGTGEDARFVCLERMDNGNAFERVSVAFRLGESVLRQEYTLMKAAHHVDVSVRADWRDAKKCLKLLFRLDVMQTEGWWQTPFGAIERKPNGIEEPLLNWVDCTGVAPDGIRRGMMLACRDKGGAHLLGSELGLTVLRSPVYANHTPNCLPRAAEPRDCTDQGVHTFTYRLIPHVGSWRDGGITALAMEHLQPAATIVETFHAGPLAPSSQGIQIDRANILMSCFKPANDKDGSILRLYESCGIETHAHIELPLVKLHLEADFKPFEVRTWRLRSDCEPVECMLTEYPMQEEEKA